MELIAAEKTMKILFRRRTKLPCACIRAFGTILAFLDQRHSFSLLNTHYLILDIYKRY